MKAKNVVLVLAVTGLVSSQVLAAEAGIEGVSSAQTPDVFTEADASGLFEQSGKPMQMAALSSAEMKDTEGAAIPWLAYRYMGALAGAYGEAWGYYAGGGRSVGGLLGSVTSGAVAGAVSPISGIRNAAQVMGVTAIGTAAGTAVTE